MNRSSINLRFWFILTLSMFLGTCASERMGRSVMWEELVADLEIKRVTPEMRVRMEKVEEDFVEDGNFG